MNILTILKQVVTESDNTTNSLGRWLGLLSFIFFHVMQIVDMIINHSAFNAVGYAAGIAALFSTLGVMLGLSPGEKHPPDKP